MEDKEGAMEWVDCWLRAHGGERKFLGPLLAELEDDVDWDKDVGYEVQAEEETWDNRTAKSSRTKPKRGVWVVRLKDGKIAGAELPPEATPFTLCFELYRDPVDSCWAGNPIEWDNGLPKRRAQFALPEEGGGAAGRRRRAPTKFHKAPPGAGSGAADAAVAPGGPPAGPDDGGGGRKARFADDDWEEKEKIKRVATAFPKLKGGGGGGGGDDDDDDGGLDLSMMESTESFASTKGSREASQAGSVESSAKEKKTRFR